MKRNAVWLIVPVALAAALGGVKYRLDHPPLSQADRAFRQMADRADEIQLMSLGMSVARDNHRMAQQDVVIARLKGKQIRELEEDVRLLDGPDVDDNAVNGSQYHLLFYRQNRLLGGVAMHLQGQHTTLYPTYDLHSRHPLHSPLGTPIFGRSIHPRFEHRFTAYLKQLQATSYWQPVPLLRTQFAPNEF